MFCTKCGREIQKDSVFCQYCGHKRDAQTKSRPKLVIILAALVVLLSVYSVWSTWKINDTQAVLDSANAALSEANDIIEVQAQQLGNLPGRIKANYYCATKKSGICYHKQSCSVVEGKDLIYLKSEKTAKNAGYKPCKVCID